MKGNMRLCLVVAALVVVAVVLGLPTSLGQERRTYEIHSVPVAQTDAARALEAYERLLARHLDLTEQNLAVVAADLRAMAAQLDTIRAQGEKLDAWLGRIEKHLGIVVETPRPPAPDSNAPAVPSSWPPAVPVPSPTPNEF
jgi:hypothetical protein